MRQSTDEVRASLHVLTRYCEHHPGSKLTDVRAAWREAKDIDPAVVWAVTQRKGIPSKQDVFRLAADGKGIFAGIQGRKEVNLVTYLRLGEMQQAVLREEQTTRYVSDADLTALYHEAEVLSVIAWKPDNFERYRDFAVSVKQIIKEVRHHRRLLA